MKLLILFSLFTSLANAVEDPHDGSNAAECCMTFYDYRGYRCYPTCAVYDSITSIEYPDIEIKHAPTKNETSKGVALE